MSYTITENFVPFKISLDVNTREELEALWIRLNLGRDSLKQVHTSPAVDLPRVGSSAWSFTSNLWSALDNKLQALKPEPEPEPEPTFVEASLHFSHSSSTWQWEGLNFLCHEGVERLLGPVSLSSPLELSVGLTSENGRNIIATLTNGGSHLLIRGELFADELYENALHRFLEPIAKDICFEADDFSFFFSMGPSK